MAITIKSARSAAAQLSKIERKQGCIMQEMGLLRMRIWKDGPSEEKEAKIQALQNELDLLVADMFAIKEAAKIAGFNVSCKTLDWIGPSAR